RPPKPRPR
nr:Chain D, 8-residue peptide from a signal transduction protein CBL-B [synthetic construct]